MKFRTILYIGVLLIAFVQSVKAQQYSRVGFTPTILVKKSLSPAWSWSASLASESFTSEDTYDGRIFEPEVLNIGLQGVLSYDWTPEFTVDMAVLYRRDRPFGDGSTEIRLWPQVTYMEQLNKYRVRNRLRVEGRLRDRGLSDKFVMDWRVRYRFSVDFPLSGERLDVNEFYINASSEALVTVDQPNPFNFWENRTYGGLGYVLTDKARIETGLEFRTGKVSDSLRRNIFFAEVIYVRKL